LALDAKVKQLETAAEEKLEAQASCAREQLAEQELMHLAALERTLPAMDQKQADLTALKVSLKAKNKELTATVERVACDHNEAMEKKSQDTQDSVGDQATRVCHCSRAP